MPRQIAVCLTTLVCVCVSYTRCENNELLSCECVIIAHLTSLYITWSISYGASVAAVEVVSALIV